MKKLYASLAVIAAASIVSASAQSMVYNPLPTKADKMVQRVENVIPMDARKAINHNTDAKIESRNARIAQRDHMMTAAPAYVTASETAGDWTSLFHDIWSDSPNLFCSEGVILTLSGDVLRIQGLGEFEELEGENTAGETLIYAYYNGGAEATVDGNKLTINCDEPFGYITIAGTKSYDMYFAPGTVTEEDDEYSVSLLDGNMTFTYDGTVWVADTPLVVYMVSLSTSKASIWATHTDTRLVQPTADFTGQLTYVDFAHKIYTEIGEDTYGKYLFVSSASPRNDGYCVYYDIDDDEMTATANEAVIQDENQSYYEGYGPFYLSSAIPDWDRVEGSSVYVDWVKYLTLNFSDDQKSFWYNNTLSVANKTGETGMWTVMNYSLSDDVSGYWYGRCDDYFIEIYGGAGVNNIAADVKNENAPVEYFNIMGQKVTNPAAGTLVIKRQGNEVTKMIVR